MYFYDREEFVRSLGRLAKTDIAYGVELEWVMKTAKRLLDAGKKNMYFIVKQQDEKGNVGYIIPPTQYKLYIDGYDLNGKIKIAEDFPPVMWPDD